MSTTLLFAEILIIGLQASLWMVLLVLVEFGVSLPLALFSAGLADWQTVLVALSLSFVYAIGIIVDRLADLVFSSWDRDIRKSFLLDQAFPVIVIRFRLAKDNENLNRQFDYLRSRMRISRASIINLLFVTFIGPLYINQLNVVTADTKVKVITTWVLAGALLAISAFYAWQKLTKSYYSLIKTTWETASKEIKKPS